MWIYVLKNLLRIYVDLCHISVEGVQIGSRVAKGDEGAEYRARDYNDGDVKWE